MAFSARQLIDTAAGANSPAAVVVDDANPDDKEGFHALAVLTLMGLLGLSLAFGRVLERNKINWMSEAGGALIVGIGIGLIVTLAKNAGLDYNYAILFQFNVDYFFLFLLPPIIFDAGFNLDVKPFFDNVGGITTLAFAGTAVSTAVIAAMMWLSGLIGLSFRIPFFHSCLFGAIISATDPVTVLAIFGRMHADANLNALVFGESVLNDAVAIVLYNVILKFGESAGGGSSTAVGVLGAVWAFVYKFGSSLVIGVALALTASLLFRSGYFKDEHAPVEAALVILIAYCSFYLADGFNLSGITSIMFCGIAMAKYCRPNLSEKTDERVGAFFRVIAYLAEIFVFIYIGLALFTDSRARKIGQTWTFMAVGLAALALSRLANVYPLTAACNVLTPHEARRIPPAHKRMLWFSGLRGAMAFALATQNASAQRDSGSAVDRDSADVILTATFFMVLITVLVNGGAAYYLLKRWHLTSEDSGAAAGPHESQEMAHMLGDHSSATSTALEPNGAASPQVLCGGAFGASASRGLIQSIHNYQRTGGLTKQFEQLDRAVTDYLVVSADLAETMAPAGSGEQQALARRGSRAGGGQQQGMAQADTGSLAEQ